MELSLYLCVSVIGIFLVGLYWLYSFAIAPFRVLARCGIQGPPPLPLYGNYRAVARMGRTKFIEKMIKEHGPVFGFYLGQKPVVVVADVDLVKEVTVKQFDHFHDRCVTPYLLDKEPGNPMSLAYARGDYWKKLRVTLSPTFSAAKMKVMASLIVDHCNVLVEVMDKCAETNSSVEVSSMFNRLTVEVVLATVFGRDVDIQRGLGQRDELVQAVDTLFSRVQEGKLLSYDSVALILSNFPCMEPLLCYLASRSKEAAAYHVISDVGLRLITACRESSGHFKHLLQLMIDATVDNVEDRRRLSDEEILAQCITFLLMGPDSTANSLTFTAYLLALNPDIQKKLIVEIDKYCKENHGVSAYDMAQEITYLDMVVQESLRLYPIAPFFCRSSTNTTDIGTITIPKGTQITVPVWHIHRDSRHWTDPHKFDPERFTPQEKAKRHPLAHIPFGWGPRNCIGLRLALLVTKLALISILRKYKFVKTPETEEHLQVSWRGLSISPTNGVFLKIAGNDTQYD